MSATLNAHCPDIECDGCANAIRRSLGKVEGVENIGVDIDHKNVTVQFDDGQVTEAALLEKLERAGFPAEPAA